MRSRPTLFALLLLACVATSCRAAQIQKLEDRIDKLEARQAATEARLEVLQKK